MKKIKGVEEDQRDGTPLLSSQAGAVQPGQEKTPGRPQRTFQHLQESWGVTFRKGI